MKNSENIEKLFKDTFENFEADVNPQVWANVQNGINAASGSTASAGAKFALGKIIAGAISVALISGSIWYFSSSDNKIVSAPEKQGQSVKPPISKEEITPVLNVEQQAPAIVANSNTDNNTGWQIPPAVRTLNQHPTGSAGRNQSVSRSNDHVVSSDVSTLENGTSASQPAHKYGNATQGDGGMIRGSHNVPASSGASSSGSSADIQQVEDPKVSAAAISLSTSYGNAPLTVDFYNQRAASSSTWNFGDGAESRESSPSHTFDKPGIYVVKLTAKNSSGTSTDKVTIEVKSISHIKDVPTIFTPNGDGVNDVFFFDVKNIASIGVAIFSQRTGELIAKWNNLDGNWNGKLKNGTDAPVGVYLYSIQAIGSDGVTHSEKGFVTINR